MANNNSSASISEKPVHKWPIRPGVHVHVNGLHVLNNSNASETKISGFSYGARNNSTTASDGGSDGKADRADLLEDGGHGDQTRTTSTTATVARGTSTSDMMRSHNETMASAASEAAASVAASNNNRGHTMASPKETTVVNNSNSFEFCILHRVGKEKSSCSLLKKSYILIYLS